MKFFAHMGDVLHRWVDKGRLIHAKYHPNRFMGGGIGLKNWKVYNKFLCIRPAHPFYDIFRDCVEPRAGSHVKILGDLIKRFHSYGF